MNAEEFKLNSAVFVSNVNRIQGHPCCMNGISTEKCRVMRQASFYLSLDSIRKMMSRFLTEKKMSKSELASLLEINIKSIDNIFAGHMPQGLLPKVNLQLTRLYCSTKW